MSCTAILRPIVNTNTQTKNNQTTSSSKKVATRPPLTSLNRSNDYLSVAERINGRAAMVGFTSAVVDEVMTGHSISTQFQENIGLSVAVTALAFIGTASNPKDEGYIQGFWKPETELINGRFAMIGILSLLLTESIHPQVPLF